MEKEEIKSKLDKFISGKMPVHIVLKKKNEDSAPRFFNGIVLANPEEGVYAIDERKLGETYVFLEDIYDINIYVKKIERPVNDGDVYQNQILSQIKKNPLKEYIAEGIMSEERGCKK